MPEESTTPDLVERMRGLFDAANRRDADAMVSFFGPDAVVDDPDGVGTLERVALLGFLEDWFANYEALEVEAEEIVGHPNGVVFGAYRQRGRPVGSIGEVQLRQGWVALFEDGMIARMTVYFDIDEGRAAAERLAEERG